MSDLIDRQKAIDALRYAQHRFTVADEAGGFGTVKWSEDVIYFAAAERVLSELPSAQPDRELIEQLRWERNTAIQQLKDLGYGLGEKVRTEVSSANWIPCSERLPEIGQSVLLSVGGMYSAEGCLREDGDWAQFRWDAIQRKDMVGAWKPLLEPYKGEQE